MFGGHKNAQQLSFRGTCAPLLFHTRPSSWPLYVGLNKPSPNHSTFPILTLGVAYLRKATEFYKIVIGTPLNTSFDGITFIELPGTWLGLYPFEKLAEDISPDIPATVSGFSGVTLAHNARSKDDVIAIVRRADWLVPE